MDLLLGGRELSESHRQLGTAGRDLGEARSLLSATPELGYMVAAVDQELATVRTVGSMPRTLWRTSVGSSPPSPLHSAARGSARLVGSSQSERMGTHLPLAKLREETFRRAAEVRGAKPDVVQ